MDGRVVSHMRRAIELSNRYRPHPNPKVGAILLDSVGRVIGEGAHSGPGTPHAEINALSVAGEAARGGTIVVTLEPCSHHGRTPPCTDALIEAGVKAVIFGAIDPDVRASGSGARILQKAGIEAIGGLLNAEVEAGDPGYFHHRRTGLPFITLKAAITLDGQTAAADGTSQWITGPEARKDAHLLRAAADAVLIGAGTLLADDPALDVRLEGYDGPQPRPVVIAGRRPLPSKAKIRERNPLVIATAKTGWPDEVVVIPGQDGLPDLRMAMAAIAESGLLDVVVEGGASLAGALWAQGLVNRGVFYLSGRIAGGQGLGVFATAWATLEDARTVEITDVTRFGGDLRVDWRVLDAPPPPQNP